MTLISRYAHEDHPRGCGEHGLAGAFEKLGKAGIIPADAGSTYGVPSIRH